MSLLSASCLCGYNSDFLQSLAFSLFICPIWQFFPHVAVEGITLRLVQDGTLSIHFSQPTAAGEKVAFSLFVNCCRLTGRWQLCNLTMLWWMRRTGVPCSVWFGSCTWCSVASVLLVNCDTVTTVIQQPAAHQS